MSGFSLKPQHTGDDYDGPKVDWAAVAAQVEEGTQPARISVLVDLGVQVRGKGVSHQNKDDITIVGTEEERDALMDEAEEIMGEWSFEKEKLGEWDDAPNGKFSVPFKIYEKKDAQEVAIFADLPDTEIVYVEGEDPKQYRVMLNSNFMGKIEGFALTKSKPQKDGDPWTFGPTTKLTKLAKACDCDEVLDGGQYNMDIGRILGKEFLVEIVKKKDFVNAKGFVKVMARDKGRTPELTNGPIGITFDGATVELLEAAQLRKGLIDKIKTATNYAGSAMQSAIEQMEANSKNRKSATSEVDSDDSDEPEAAPKTRGRKKASDPVRQDTPEEKAPVEAPRGRGRAKKVVVEDDFDEDIPF